MGLVGFDRWRVGFWLAERAENARAELPADAVPSVVGTPSPDGRALLVSAIDAGGRPGWSWILHAPAGGALLCTWGPRLFVALGPTALLLDAQGAALGHRDTAPDEVIAAWPVPEGLLVLGRRTVRLLDEGAVERWRSALDGDGLIFLGAEAGCARVALLDGSDWRELALDLATGTLLHDRAG